MSLLFLDTETTGLHPDRDEIWEIAAVLRDDEGQEDELHLFVEHSPALCALLPGEFLTDHQKRYPIDCWTGRRAEPLREGYFSRADAVKELLTFVGDSKPHMVGATPSFDDYRLGRLIRGTHGQITRIPWHYHLRDVETLALGWLTGRASMGDEDALGWLETDLDNSERLSLAIGVDPAKYARHTAMGDVRWVMAQYDVVTASAGGAA